MGPTFSADIVLEDLVAFEMAQQLKTQNEEVGLLVLLAPSTPKNLPFFTSSSKRAVKCPSDENDFEMRSHGICERLQCLSTRKDDLM